MRGIRALLSEACGVEGLLSKAQEVYCLRGGFRLAFAGVSGERDGCLNGLSHAYGYGQRKGIDRDAMTR